MINDLLVAIVDDLKILLFVKFIVSLIVKLLRSIRLVDDLGRARNLTRLKATLDITRWSLFVDRDD